jgi:hypothetical protein
MITPEQVAQLKDQIVEEAIEDYVGLWSIVKQIRRVVPELSDDGIREITIDLLRDLLDAGVLTVGFPTLDGGSFESWTISSRDAITRIEQEWALLGRDPNIGEIVWVTTPDDEGAQNGQESPPEASMTGNLLSDC